MSLEKRVELLEKLVTELRAEVNAIKGKKQQESDNKPWKRNSVGDYMIKVLYPGILQKQHRADPKAGFPNNRKLLAQQIKPGQTMIIYSTDPIKKIIGVGETTSFMKEVDSQWKYSIDFKWIVPPKHGLTFEEVGLDIRVIVGDTIFSLTPKKANEIIERLKQQPDLDESTMDYIVSEYERIHKK